MRHYTAKTANGQPAWLGLSPEILGRKTTDLTHLKFLYRFSYILCRSMKFIFSNYEKKWQLPAKFSFFCDKIAWKGSFVPYHISKQETLLT